jgi:hypothetical protein
LAEREAVAAEAVAAVRHNGCKATASVRTNWPHPLHQTRAINNAAICWLVAGYYLLIAANDAAFFSYSSRLGSFILARFA